MGQYSLFKSDQQYSAYLNRHDFIRWFNDTVAKSFVPH